jgi:hypothetical protein
MAMHESPSGTNIIPPSGHTLPTPVLSCVAYRRSPTENHSSNPINTPASKYSSASSLGSGVPSAVKSSSSATSRTSSLTSSHHTTGASSVVHVSSDTQSSLLPVSNNQQSMPSPNSNLTSDDLMGIINGKLPELLPLPNDFLPAKKKFIDQSHGSKMWRYAVHFDRSLPEMNPSYSQMESFVEKINNFYEEANDNLSKCLLERLMVRCLSFYFCDSLNKSTIYYNFFVQIRRGQSFIILMQKEAVLRVSTMLSYLPVIFWMTIILCEFWTS